MRRRRGELEPGQGTVPAVQSPQAGTNGRPPNAKKKRVGLFYLLLGVAVFCFLPSACALYNPAAFIQHQTDLNAISSKASQVDLQWDPPASGASQVVSYAVSYRVHGTSAWTPLATVLATAQPSYIVLRTAIGNGEFDFAVAAVDSTGATSPLHTSLDVTADPTTGWFLSWGP